LCGSSDLYESSGRRPSASINFITAHDGFTLHDLVSYYHKHNEANGEENRDGTNDNHSWNHGAEGPTEEPGIIELRERQKRNLLATLLLSQGVPMICGGDEIGRSQQGNNNAYCQDNELSWYDWKLDERKTALLDFACQLIAFRRQHPNLRRHKYFQGRPIRGGGVKDIIWVRADGGEMTDEEWGAGWHRALGLRLNGDAFEIQNEQGQRVSDDTLLLLLNAHHEPVQFTLPAFVPEAKWAVVCDTARPKLEPEKEVVPGQEPVTLEARSLVVLRFVQ